MQERLQSAEVQKEKGQTEKTRVFPKKYAEIHGGLASSDSKVKFVMYLFSDGPREYDFLLKILSLGRDSHWRNSIAARVKQFAEDQRGRLKNLDVACGSGLVSFQLARLGMSIVGIDVTREMLTRAVSLCKEGSRRNYDVDFVQARAESLPFREGYFDTATISLATRNVSSIPDTFSEMARCIRRGGCVISMDFTRPNSKIFRPFYYFYIFNVLPALGLAISRHWNGIFSYLARSISHSKTPEQLEEVMRSSGLANVEIKRMTKGATALVSAVKPR